MSRKKRIAIVVGCIAISVGVTWWTFVELRRGGETHHFRRQRLS
jgi:hypothetical protein